MPLSLYNSLGRAVEPFVSLEPSSVRMYACGPTVYNFAHIGNLRTYIFEDLLRRALEYFGYRVTHVMNVTDVGHLSDDGDAGEDKIIKAARERGWSVWDIANHFSEAFFSDVDQLNIERPEITCKATDHIDDMIRMIKSLEDRGFTYAAGGNLYFDVSKFPEYGKMALLDQQDQRAGARVEVDQFKRNARDFVLWFTNSKFGQQAMVWDSPWGRGYPGWHIECSAMSTRYLGEQFDIHCGGVDHIPVHHTNEIAQTEAATGKSWVRYWIHGEFLVLHRAKMSKSSGTFLTLSTLNEMGYSAMDYRYFCLGAHYRTQLTFSDESIGGAKAALQHLVDRLARLDADSGYAAADSAAETAYRPDGDSSLWSPSVRAAMARFDADVGHDLNIPKALAELWTLVKDDSIEPTQRLSAVRVMDRVFGLRLWPTVLERRTQPAGDTAGEAGAQIDALVAERAAARAARDFARADAIRADLQERGIVVEDTPTGPIWKKL